MINQLIPVILSGGSGTRLWPLSRKHRPKQFLPVVDEFTLFQSTILRLQGITELEAPVVVCNEEHRFMVAEQLRECDLPHQGILLEPIGRNTAPAIALAAFHICAQHRDANLLVLPADHVIRDTLALHHAIGVAQQAANDGFLVTFGIVPNKPETGYGYIQQGETINTYRGSTHRVAAFVEKPDITTAEHYLASGEYLWNSGMFLFRASRFLEELARWQPEVLGACQQALLKDAHDLDFIRVCPDAFATCPNISVDYAVMEKTMDAVVVPLDAGWNDVGAWSAVWEDGKQDQDGNVLRGDALIHNAHNNLVHTEHRLVALVGVDDLVVIDTKDATLVARRDQVQDVKKIVDQLNVKNRPEATLHREVNRPWGSYDSIDSGHRFQVKRIVVKPGERLSLQMHYHRAEHWIVVKGTAEVHCGEKTLLLTENQSTYIPLGETHQLVNPGKVPLEIIEVQSGSYLGEDDIVRFSDQYGRLSS
ncbi:mannose-1-phosphate guanylyltransferase/mannose-6-phosphate isomerase [Thiothrix unzii]|uniref:mannose-1-phosphate guanylyltransferase n=1 Tax=Thiothrix unzii TaxID=111769 RepID=A0A975IIL8_9GAMM|nr:mannose-1-phosphate guanylyltransferase/mannose-6-phosphate isomerase [Thiothrix unzii]QTR55326.1 mannose-1-phosphate guanylyltransferase/mannose-6-phosphate isomerase [Thiothrix unzii]